MLYSTYFGGSSSRTGLVLGGGIAVDSDSNAYITGGTRVTDMPLLNAYQGLNEGGFDAYVAKINPSGVTGAQLLYSTYLGGSGDDVGFGVAVDSKSSNSIFFQTEVTKEMLLQDTTISVLKRCNYWGAEYLLLYKHRGLAQL